MVLRYFFLLALLSPALAGIDYNQDCEKVLRWSSQSSSLVFTKVEDKLMPFQRLTTSFQVFDCKIIVSCKIFGGNTYSWPGVKMPRRSVAHWSVNLLSVPLTALRQKSHLCIPRKGSAQPQSQFPHSCAWERFIYSQDRSTYFPAAE